MMKDERRQRLLDQYEDAALQLLMDEYAEAEGERLLKEFEEAERRGEVEDIPEELDQKCRQIIHRSFAAKRRKDKVTSIGKMLGKVAVIVFLLTGFSTTVVLSVEAFRVPVLNYLIKNNIRFTSLLFSDKEEEVEENPYDEVAIDDFIPSEYRLIKKNVEQKGISSFVYENTDSKIISLQITPSDGMLNYDTENANTVPMKINGHEAIYIEKEGNRIIWFDAERSLIFDLYSNGLNKSEFWEIAYGLAEVI